MTPIQEYRKWLQEEIRIRKGATNMGAAMMAMGYEDALQKLDIMFLEDTQTPDHLDKIPGMHEPITIEQIADKVWKELKGIPDETDNIYPKAERFYCSYADEGEPESRGVRCKEQCGPCKNGYGQRV